MAGLLIGDPPVAVGNDPGRTVRGAHLPLDLVGGAGLGLILSTVMQHRDEHTSSSRDET
jgi:hypothetical protein